MIFFRASAYGRPELARAFNEYAQEHGHDVAVEALERSTGARDLASVPEHRIINALTELICGFSFAAKTAQKPANIEEALADIRERAFAKMRGEKAE